MHTEIFDPVKVRAKSAAACLTWSNSDHTAYAFQNVGVSSTAQGGTCFFLRLLPSCISTKEGIILPGSTIGSHVFGITAEHVVKDIRSMEERPIALGKGCFVRIGGITVKNFSEECIISHGDINNNLNNDFCIFSVSDSLIKDLATVAIPHIISNDPSRALLGDDVVVVGFPVGLYEVKRDWEKYCEVDPPANFEWTAVEYGKVCYRLKVSDVSEGYFSMQLDQSTEDSQHRTFKMDPEKPKSGMSGSPVLRVSYSEIGDVNLTPIGVVFKHDVSEFSRTGKTYFRAAHIDRVIAEIFR